MSDAPPSYDASGSTLSKTPLDDKKAVGTHAQPIPSISSDSKSVALLGTSPRHGLFDVFRKHRQHPPTVPPLAGDTSTARTAVIDDVRLVVQPNTGSVAERVSLLESCAQLCTRHKIDFSLLLQEKNSFHGHTALYWAIVNNPGPLQAPFQLVVALLVHSAPLKPETIKEARRACISLRNQELFQFLRMRPEFGALSAEDRFLLGTLVPPEEIDIQLIEGPSQPFSVKFKIPMFQKRMMLARQIHLEFIARERLWRLSFFTPANPTSTVKSAWFEKGQQWGGCLFLRENSPSTCPEYGLVLLDARDTPEPAHAWTWGWDVTQKPTRNEDEPASESNRSGWIWSLFGEGAQADNVCIAPDGSITGILGMKLDTGNATKPTSWPPKTIPTKPEEECVIC
ncbi:hypothetical protein B0H11DRAFT_228071 [Mycena galericulata]|nr:hypothetical protein B0H11DRAFT_228071 [Mycena galericulata]